MGLFTTITKRNVRRFTNKGKIIVRRLKKWSIEEIKQYQSFIDSKYTLLSNIYTRNRDRLHFVCTEGHDHFATWTKFLAGERCAKCFGNKLMNIEEIKNALQIDGYKLIDAKYKNCMASMKMICPKGHIWMSSWNNFKSGYRCLECNRVKQMTIEVVEKEAAARGYIVENRGVIINKSTKLGFICPKGHHFITHWDSFRIHGCSNLECVEEKKRQTNIKLFGVANTSMLKEFQDKQARSANNKTIKNHWKSGHKLICTGSYETAVIDFLNHHRIEYEWQPTVIYLSKRTYRPDLYLSSTNIWVEIKGRWIRDAKEKWEEFNQKYPNSEVWLLKDLKKFGFKHNYGKLIFNCNMIYDDLLIKCRN